MVVVEEMCAGAWSLICEREDISELECLMVSAITRLNDYGVLIGWRQSRGKGQTTIRFVVILVRKAPGLHIEKSQSCLEMGERVGGN